VGFFRFIRNVNAFCFTALVKLPPPQFKLVVDSIVWAFKHTMRDIADTGLQITYELLGNVHTWQQTNPAGAASFYRLYFIPLMQDIFFVLTDQQHKSGARPAPPARSPPRPPRPPPPPGSGLASQLRVRPT
jgi:exportin-1